MRYEPPIRERLFKFGFRNYLRVWMFGWVVAVDSLDEDLNLLFVEVLDACEAFWMTGTPRKEEDENYADCYCDQALDLFGSVPSPNSAEGKSI